MPRSYEQIYWRIDKPNCEPATLGASDEPAGLLKAGLLCKLANVAEYLNPRAEAARPSIPSIGSSYSMFGSPLMDTPDA